MKELLNELAHWIADKTDPKEKTNFEKYVARITKDHKAWEKR